MVKSLRLFEPKLRVEPRIRERRGSRQERGYDYDWEKRASAYRKKNPICVECERDDRIIPADVVDHKIPVQVAPDLRLDPKNWWSLCHECHNGMKRRMEAYAVKHGLTDKLILWCDDPATRPAMAATYRRKKTKEEFIV